MIRQFIKVIFVAALLRFSWELSQTREQDVTTQCIDENGVQLPRCLPIERLTEGKAEVGDSGTAPFDLPAWGNIKLARQGQDMARKYFYAIFLGHLFSLVILLGQITTRRLLHYTMKSETPAKALQRYMGTLLQVQLWYDIDIDKPDPSLYRSLLRVRQIHADIGQRIQRERPDFTKQLLLPPTNSSFFSPERPTRGAEAAAAQVVDWIEWPVLWNAVKKDIMASDLRFRVPWQPPFIPLNPRSKAGNDTYYFSQYEMAITLWSFMGLPITIPQSLGIHDATEEEYAAFIHLWTVLAHILGIQEEYNFCIQKDFLACKQYSLRILREHFLPEFFRIEPETEIMWKALITGGMIIVPQATADWVLISILEDIAGINCPNLSKVQTWTTWLMRRLQIYVLTPTLRFGFVKRILNFVLKYNIRSTSIRTFGFDSINQAQVAASAYY